MQIRPARPADREALLAISLATGDAGGDAARLYRDGDLIGLIYSAPYLALEPDLAPVAQDGDGVAGFAVGTADTPAFEARLERDWWPPLRAAHPAPEGDPAAWTADERRIARFHAPRLTPTAVTARRPAHLQLNLLPRAHPWRTRSARRARASSGCIGMRTNRQGACSAALRRETSRRPRDFLPARRRSTAPPRHEGGDPWPTPTRTGSSAAG